MPLTAFFLDEQASTGFKPTVVSTTLHKDCKVNYYDSYLVWALYSVRPGQQDKSLNVHRTILGFLNLLVHINILKTKI